MNMEILKEKIKADKKLIVASNMNLNDAEAKNFWPLYEGYQKELEQINQRLITMIKGYADAFNAGKGELSDDQAKKLLGEALAVEESEVKLRQSYAAKIGQGAAGYESRPVSADRKQNPGDREVRIGRADSAGELVGLRPSPTYRNRGSTTGTNHAGFRFLESRATSVTEVVFGLPGSAGPVLEWGLALFFWPHKAGLATL